MNIFSTHNDKVRKNPQYKTSLEGGEGEKHTDNPHLMLPRMLFHHNGGNFQWPKIQHCLDLYQHFLGYNTYKILGKEFRWEEVLH